MQQFLRLDGEFHRELVQHFFCIAVDKLNSKIHASASGVVVEAWDYGGYGLTILIDIPVSLIVRALTGIPYLTASLPTGAAIVLVLISMGLTLIAGLIPSRIAARKDPVVALRTE